MDITIYKNYNGHVITCSTDIKLLRTKYDLGETVIFLITNKNRFEDSTFIRYALEIEEYDPDCYDENGEYCAEGVMNMCLSEESVDNLIDEDYLSLAYARSTGSPLRVFETERTYVRELCLSDLEIVKEFYETEKLPFLENLFNFVKPGDESEIEEDNEEYYFFERYCHDFYDYYNYGIWGVFEKITNEFMGLMGFVPRRSDIAFAYGRAGDKEKSEMLFREIENNKKLCLEMGFAFKEKFRRQGYAYESCTKAIEYAAKNIEYDKIVVDINPENIRAIQFAKAIGLYN